MLERKALQELKAWKKRSNGHTALLIEGARRVGKTTLAQTFAQDAYKTYIEINFDSADNALKSIFTENANDLDRLFQYISTYYNVALYPRKTLFIFDEIQQFPFARGLIKHLVADGRYDYLETGSLLSIKQNIEGIVIPSEEETLRLNPLDFEEFLWALNEFSLATLLRECFANHKSLPDALHKKASKLFREYLLVGGMPHPVQVYVDTKDFGLVDYEKRLILNLYRNDIARFALRDKYKVVSIFDQIPAQLSKHEKRFSVASINKNARMRAYEEAFFWLGDAFIANLCYASNSPNVGLSLNLEKSAVKCYMADTGLLVTMVLADEQSTTNDVYKAVLLGEVGLNEGMLIENVVAQALVANGRKLFFYTQSGKNNKKKGNSQEKDSWDFKGDATVKEPGAQRLEIDFLIRTHYANAANKPRISPIEVKSQKQYGTSSLERLKEEYSKYIGEQYIVSPKPLRRIGERLYVPLYMAHLL